MSKMYTVAVIGCGSRGWVYGNEMFNKPDKYKMVAICDIDETRLKNAQQKWGIDDANVYTDEKEFFKEKRADVLILATQDRDHVRMCVRAMELGYDILLEKPISPIRDELIELLEANKKYKRAVVVCHVLRYAPAFVKVKQLLDEGVIGKLIRIESLEQVAYWHQAHSFVRGNWRNDKETSPMIMQKCCHDLDLLQWYVGSRCSTVYSSGDLAFFNRENQPEGASDRCQDCKYINTCPYSAEKLYIGKWKEQDCPEWGWPFNVVCSTIPNTEDGIRKAYQEGQYGRCVFACDNNVVDNQSVDMVFENGVKVTLTMTAFTNRMGRNMSFHGSLGVIELNEDSGEIVLDVYGEKRTIYKIKDLVENEKDEFNHGGGDAKLCDSLYAVINDGVVAGTSLESSVESHLMALAAEKSRKENIVVKVHED